MVQHVDRWLPHILGALGSGEEIGSRRVHWPVTVPYPQGIQDIPRSHVVFPRQLRNPMSSVISPGRQKTVPMLIEHEGSQVIVGAAVFEAILIVGEYVNKVVPP